MNRAKKMLIGTIVVLFLLAGGIYGGGVYYFSLHFLPGTEINQMDCSFMNILDVQSRIKEQAKVYVLVLDERNHGREVLEAEDLGVRYRTKNRLEEFLRKQQKWRWFLELRNTFILDKTACIEYDKEQMEQSVMELRCMQPSEITPVKNAAMVQDGEQFVAIPCVEGDQLNRERVFQAIDEAILSGKTAIDLDLKGCYEEPTVREDDPVFVENLEHVNRMMRTILTYDFGRESERVDYRVLSGWITPDETGRYSLNPNRVAAYVVSLARKYDEEGKEFNFRTYDLRTIPVSVQNMGWVIDQEAEVQALANDIENGTIAVREPMYRKRGISRKNDGAGDTYVEIDLGNQRMVVYKDGSLKLDTQIVSGNMVEGYATPIGCFPVGRKASGIYVPGEVREIQYWIPFTPELGILEAPWREEFGGDLYNLVGTRGNVEISLEDARIVYESVSEGDPVIIYN